MKPKIVHARDSEVMYQLSDLFLESKYSIKGEDSNFVLLKKNNYGNLLIHLPFLLIAIFFNAYVLLVNVVYFAYSIFKKSNVILITTENKDDEGNPLEFDSVRELEVFYDESTWNKAIELSELE
ncbi:hypothetical protein [Methanobrevibacter olleyae]|uniref:Uncharacterized protein n=1 Tax=Methanobrevibacter olleyae TaxID=294671 RepID=A0A126QYK6_METOL|nr:hypothetical protein [Methanobrevibacter olleyae]AMK14897.1 hypothetical protein YLM1_0337 [Methanobrevibacter olleyae]SFL44231.1 hypothetical protein SAMN02910297_00894 [Methanobrevibacter olleyae]